MDRRNFLTAAAATVPALAIGGTLLGSVATEIATAAPASAALSPSAHSATASLPPTFGVQFHGLWAMYYVGSSNKTNTMFTSHLNSLAAHGVKVIRVDFGWSGSQPTSAAPSADYWYNQRLTNVINEAAKRGMKVLLTINQSPAWSRPGTAATNLRQYPTNLTAFTAWCKWAGQTFKNNVVGWEIWNEPNLASFTGVHDAYSRASRYVKILKAASQGLRAGNPNAVVVFGGPSQTDSGFIKTCYSLGAKPYFDIMAVHPYQGNQTMPPESTDNNTMARMTHLPVVIDVMKQYNDQAKPIWWTEFGFSVHSNSGIPKDAANLWRLGVATPEIAGDYLARAFKLAQEKYPQVRLGIAYTTYSSTTDPEGRQQGFRMINADGTVRAQLPIIKKYFDGFAKQRPLI